jgi:hypothetical protein
MKRYIILGALLVSAAFARADLGDTYAQDCRAYGGRGTVDKKNHLIFWHYSKHYIVEAFVKNKCVMMCLEPDKGLVYTISDAQRIIAYNAGTNQLWRPYEAGPNFTQGWVTTDDLIYAGLMTTGSVRVCYKWWLEGKGLNSSPETGNYGEAPVEDVPSDGTQM